MLKSPQINFSFGKNYHFIQCLKLARFNSRTKSVAIFLSLPIANSYCKKMLKCGKKLGIIKNPHSIRYLYYEDFLFLLVYKIIFLFYNSAKKEFYKNKLIY